MVILIPIVKLDDKITYGVWDIIPTNIIVVRLQDLVTKKKYKFNKTFHKIKTAGGIHNFLGFSEKIIFSLIMRDEIIENFNPDLYAYAINTLNPDFFTTVDGWTYERTETESYHEIERCVNQTRALIKKCPNSIPLGQVKGSTEKQIEYHIKLLKSMGIHDFVFHIGDFSRNGSSRMMWRARKYATKIKKQGDSLILYGLGSQRKMDKFSFADAFVSFNHFVTATYGMKYVGTKKVNFRKNESRREIINDNLIEMYKNIQKMNSYQSKLKIGGDRLWAEALAELGITQEKALELEA